MKKTLHTLEIILTVIAIVFIVWAGISYIEVIAKNLDTPAIYWKYNLFQMLINAR